ncbi:MAG: phage terminase large subunit family protein [Desulfuromonas thiophila]|jgi:phage terminase large subunit GpA-like protein|nr:phage terminase large subunit family protein [Desulfuromonas thiophila]MDY0398785.1 phage terminase large subunit family protein [Desulfuromonas thiophila]
MNLISTTTAPLPPFAHLAGQRYQGTPPRALRRRMRTPEQLSISQWADKYRMVTAIDAKPGRWDSSEVPHLVKIMDCISLPHVREVYLCMPERAGKTQVLLNTMGWTIDQGSKSGNIFWLMPKEEEAKKAMAERIIPVLKAETEHGRPGRLARYLSKYDDDTKQRTIRFTTGTRLFPAWSNSPASMASFFGKLNIGDEIDKFEKSTREGTDAITLIRKRARDDRSRAKNLFASTPGAARKIYRLATAEAQQQWRYHLRCPHCQASICPDEQHLAIAEGTAPQQIELHGCSLFCQACGAELDEQQRDIAYQTGCWICTHGADIHRPETVGFHMSAYCLPRVPLAEIGAAWLRAQQGGLVEKTAYANGYRVEDFDPPRASEDYRAILAHCDDRPRDLVPTDTAALVLQVDTQMDGFYFEVAALGYASPGGSVTSHLVRKGYLLHFADLIELSRKTWHDAEGREYRIRSALIDSGGGRKAGMPPKHSRTKEVYEFCRANPLFQPVKGRPRRDKAIQYAKLDVWPGTSKPIPGGLWLINLDVHYFKDALATALHVTPGDPGSFVLYSGYTEQQLTSKAPGITPENELTDYAKHLCAEFRNELGNWEHDHKAGRNDWHDCATYRMAHIEILNQQGALSRPAGEEPKNKTTKQPPQKRRFW